MFEFLMGLIFGEAFDIEKVAKLGRITNERRERKRKYISKFTGYYENIGTRYDEEWVWVEPEYKFQHRYVQIIENNNGYIIYESWSNKDDAIDFVECENQREAESAIDILATGYSRMGNVNRKYEEIPCCINVIVDKRNIKIILSEDQREDAFEFVRCFGKDEADGIMYEMEKYYSNYGNVMMLPSFKGLKESMAKHILF